MFTPDDKLWIRTLVADAVYSITQATAERLSGNYAQGLMRRLNENRVRELSEQKKAEK